MLVSFLRCHYWDHKLIISLSQENKLCYLKIINSLSQENKKSFSQECHASMHRWRLDNCSNWFKLNMSDQGAPIIYQCIRFYLSQVLMQAEIALDLPVITFRTALVIEGEDQPRCSFTGGCVSMILLKFSIIIPWFWENKIYVLVICLLFSQDKATINLLSQE